MGAIVTFGLQDSFGRPGSCSFEHKTDTPSVGDIQALAADVAAVSKMAIVSASVASRVDVSGIKDSPDAGANRQVDAFVQCRKADGGTYTFTMFDPVTALVQPDGTLDRTASSLIAFVENFDDGAGLAGIAGNWYISDGEELREGTGGDNILSAGLNKN